MSNQLFCRFFSSNLAVICQSCQKESKSVYEATVLRIQGSTLKCYNNVANYF